MDYVPITEGESGAASQSAFQGEGEGWSDWDFSPISEREEGAASQSSFLGEGESSGLFNETNPLEEEETTEVDNFVPFNEEADNFLAMDNYELSRFIYRYYLPCYFRIVK